ncbi:hypothetical protein N7499_012642 [Penicillium canescens]|uniref:Uncharacterized protein n=1 Tax=Penicillium canescens TaxID=5083 RepID=A0AAD6I3W7_PENCN|nr:uncharacterized protein N7446_000715 [Penicillium canescens]KAJ6030225.1 hypothetical protein N7460_010491 [Penicillium canescens]KAJ6060600.1 hypothetical protein N7444_002454 [Penicillium canescens]KAJ6063962.1 hypothetical protein N7499_012642 [Penicillium canescens]KAJ6077779.1 hypothetical protein N7446_000715 [Penicillium canescens]KAJ6154542.1 hypothetical protein N7485_012911 [Penicillium canescens]
MCMKIMYYHAKCTHAAPAETSSVIGCPPALEEGCLCDQEDQTPLPFPISGLCKQCKVQKRRKEMVNRFVGIAKWKAGDRLGSLTAAMALPERDDESPEEDSEYESEYESEPETESGSDADADASDAVEPRKSHLLTRSNPNGSFHRLQRWLDKADPYPPKDSSICTSANTAKTGKMTRWPFFQAPILWKDEHDNFGLRTLVLVQKHGLVEQKDTLSRRRTICAGPGGLQPLALAEKHKKRWGWPSWDPYGREKADEPRQSEPLLMPPVEAESMKAVSLRSRIPVPASRVGGQSVAASVEKRPLLARRNTFDRVTF